MKQICRASHRQVSPARIRQRELRMPPVDASYLQGKPSRPWDGPRRLSYTVRPCRLNSRLTSGAPTGLPLRWENSGLRSESGATTATSSSATHPAGSR